MLGTGGSMLGPNELFHLDDTYAYVGERSTREVGSDMWTSTRDDIPDPEVGWEENYPKAVLEYYFSQVILLTSFCFRFIYLFILDDTRNSKNHWCFVNLVSCVRGFMRDFYCFKSFWLSSVPSNDP